MLEEVKIPYLNPHYCLVVFFLLGVAENRGIRGWGLMDLMDPDGPLGPHGTTEKAKREKKVPTE